LNYTRIFKKVLREKPLKTF